MASRTVSCPHCDVRVSVKESSAGKWIVCSSCEGEFRVPTDDARSGIKHERKPSSHELDRADRPVPLPNNDEDDVDLLDAEDVIEEVTPSKRRPLPKPSRNGRRQPQRRSRDEDDDDDWEEEPQRQNGNLALIIAVVGVVGLAFVVLIGLVLFLWLRPVGGPNGGQQLAGHQNGIPVQPAPQPDPNQVHQPQPAPNPQPSPTPQPAPNPNPQPTPAPQPNTTPQPAPIPNQPVVPPVVQPAPVQPAPAIPGQLKYAWQPNREYPYRLTIEATVGQTNERTSGICTYQLSPTPIAVNAVPQKGSGTAFVVTADGLLVTCAHVVGDARTIEVSIGGQKYPATVVAQNPARDIAVIRITAQNLPTVPLGDSEAVQLAQPIRVIGFPLSDVLGQNIKVTTGTVSGLNNDLSGKMIQTDASINPGNSGGPVVNDFGEVVGIASAKLTGNDVSTVGFAVPINDAKTLLQQNRLNIPAAPATKQKLDGPMLAERVTRATALVHVVVGASERQSSLRYTANYSTHKTNRDGSFNIGLATAMPRLETGSGKLVLDEFGKVLHFEGETQLPYLLGPMGLFAIEPLSPAGLGGWAESSQTTITRIESDGSSPFGMSGFRSRFRGPPGFPSPFADNEKRTTYQASEQATYAVGDTVNDFVGIKVGYELKSHDHPTNPYVHLKGDGLWQFNKKEGVPHSVEMKMQLTRNADNVVLKVPFTVRLDYVDPKVLAEERKVAEERRLANQKQQDDKQWDELQKLAPPPKSKLVQRYRFEAAEQPKAFAMSPTGEIFVATSTGELQIFSRDKTEATMKLKLPSNSPKSIVLSADGKVAAVAVGKQFEVFDLIAKKSERVVDGTFFGFEQAAMSNDGQKVVGTTFKGEAEFFDVKSGGRTVVPIGIRQPIAMSVSEDGQSVHVLSSDSYTAFDWSGKQLTAPVTLNRGEAGHVWAARLTTKGDAVLIGSRAAYWWDRAKNAVGRKFECPASHHNGLALSRKGDLFATTESKALLIYDTAQHTVIERFDADPSSVKQIEFSADGRFVLTMGNSRVLQVWELPAK